MSANTSPAYTNRLIHEKSPYLLQHAHNPVDWYPWGSEAFEVAQQEDKIILVSIGYATCHWCHVMERESFEDPDLAQYLNTHFVPIKVDREERPDVDKIYMDALHTLNQQGGWPLNMFLTPEGEPFTGGTYFPPDNRYGRGSFRGVLETLVQIWENERDRIYQASGTITAHLRQQGNITSNAEVDFDWGAEAAAVNYYKQAFDNEYGGFALQSQNKFPPSMGLMLLLRDYHRSGDKVSLHMVEFTLHKMRYGGIYDQLGGGLSRYSTDYEWLVPHFEKMLYDNALFVWALIETYQVTQTPFYQEAAEDVLTYIERDMLSKEGAFYSAEDADSEGEEGKFYLWDEEEFMEVLGTEVGTHAAAYWGVTRHGNFENNTTILHSTHPLETVAEKLGIPSQTLSQNIQQARQQLMSVRAQRIRPLCDDKILTSWNGLMISAFARAARVFNNAHYEAIAINAAKFILERLVNSQGRLLRRYRDGEASFLGYLSDYAQLAIACLDLYEQNYDVFWYQTAQGLLEDVNQLFHHEHGPYYDTGIDAEKLLTRNMEGYDGVEPSGNSAAALAFLKLDAYGAAGSYYEDAKRILNGFEQHLKRAGVSFSAMHWALHWTLSSPKQVVIVGERGDADTEALLAVVRQGFHPNTVTAFVPQSNPHPVTEVIPVTQNRIAVDGKATAYVCQNMTCQLPVHTPDALQEQLTDTPEFEA